MSLKLEKEFVTVVIDRNNFKPTIKGLKFDILQFYRALQLRWQIEYGTKCLIQEVRTIGGTIDFSSENAIMFDAFDKRNADFCLHSVVHENCGLKLYGKSERGVDVEISQYTTSLINEDRNVIFIGGDSDISISIARVFARKSIKNPNLKFGLVWIENDPSMSQTTLDAATNAGWAILKFPELNNFRKIYTTELHYSKITNIKQTMVFIEYPAMRTGGKSGLVAFNRNYLNSQLNEVVKFKISDNVYYDKIANSYVLDYIAIINE